MFQVLFSHMYLSLLSQESSQDQDLWLVIKKRFEKHLPLRGVLGEIF